MAEQLALSHPESARPRPPQRAQAGARQNAQPHGSATPRRASRGAGRTAKSPQRRDWPVARPKPGLVLVGLPLLGAGVDEVLGSPLGLCFTLGAVLGTVWAALLCTPSGLWWVLPMPPLLVTAITVVSQLALHGDQFAGGRSLTTASVKWTVADFPIMASAVLAALAALGVRRALALRTGDGSATRPRVVRPRGADADADAVPEATSGSASGSGSEAASAAASAAAGASSQDPSQVPVPRRSHHG
ncbi:DUF6542 domain-containing protein [Streptacidiphilus fuscans]|uniref:DUF6542 domain-containing protein n=1 Tax=Streptacidiphilus fuscans TaxID=2789292 RepID=A0A931FEI8_9ACTN|nr:DUF6542 domain-containing protein [Streptacidiphilus fuscans]MBF9070668.1 hypothetical protein [Streptacidiphilus fuscans]